MVDAPLGTRGTAAQMVPLQDFISKRVLEFTLDAFGDVYPEHQLPLLHSKRLDFWFKAGPGPRRQTPALVLVHGMTETDCSFECYSETVSFADVLRGCLRKQIS